MNTIKRYALALGLTAIIAIPSFAQDNRSSSTSVMRKRDRN